MSEHTDATIIAQLRETVARQAEELRELRRDLFCTRSDCGILSGLCREFERLKGTTLAEYIEHLEEQQCKST